MSRKYLPAAISIALFSILSVGVVFTKRPWCDEGWFASITYNLMHHGVMGLSVLDPHGFVFAPLVKGIHSHTYWVLPNYIFMQAAWCSILGLNVFTFRLLSVVWGGVALFSWYLIVWQLTQSRMVGFISALILALDQNFIVSGASGRMDMMCAALNLAASAVYLRLRVRFHLAVFAACSVLTASLLTHPNALFGAILLATIVFAIDRTRIRWRTLLIAAAPFLVALGFWAGYVLQAPDIFIAQMHAQSKIPHRFEFDWNLVRQFGRELKTRYAGSYHLRSGDLRVMATGSVLILYFGGVLGLAAVADIRRRPGSKLICLLAILDFTLLSCLQSNWYYLVYVLPALSAAAAICLVWVCERQPGLRRLAALAAATVVLLNLAGPVFRIFHNDYRGRYGAAVHYLKKNASLDDLILGSGELGFDFGFEGRIIDDCRLGFSSGRRPAFIVLDGQYYSFWFPWLSVNEPKVYQYMANLLDEEFDIVYDQKHDRFITVGSSDLPYRIYRRKSGQVPKQSLKLSED